MTVSGVRCAKVEWRSSRALRNVMDKIYWAYTLKIVVDETKYEVDSVGKCE